MKGLRAKLKGKSKLYIFSWAIVFIFWILLMCFWHTNAIAAKVFMIIYTLAIIIWSIITIIQCNKHRKNNK